MVEIRIVFRIDNYDGRYHFIYVGTVERITNIKMDGTELV
jgi:hypothetical protein